MCECIYIYIYTHIYVSFGNLSFSRMGSPNTQFLMNHASHIRSLNGVLLRYVQTSKHTGSISIRQSVYDTHGREDIQTLPIVVEIEANRGRTMSTGHEAEIDNEVCTLPLLHLPVICSGPDPHGLLDLGQADDWCI